MFVISLSNLKQEGEDRFNNKANIDLDNLSSVGQSKLDIKADKATTLEGYGITDGLNKNQITNCITEIPQRIKLELADGTLTLKAGSQVIVPNGFEEDGTTPKFDYITIEGDLSISTWGTGITNTCVLGFRKDGQTPKFVTLLPNCIFSGSTKPTPNVGNYWLWYDTVSNKIKYTSDNGATWTSEYCAFSIAITQVTNSVFTSINQVFNSMGYIGNTVWVDKGVKGLISNGRNIDGSLSNISFEIDKVETYTVSVSYQDAYAFRYHPQPEYLNVNAYYRMSRRLYSYVNLLKDRPTPKADMWYLVYVKEDNNIWWSSSGAEYIKLNACDIFNYDTDNNGNIVKFCPKQACSLLSKEDSSEISGWSIPSSKIVTLTAGASGTKYTAPANGWVKCWGYKNTADVGYVQLFASGGISTHSYVQKGWGSGPIFIPVRKGQQFWVEYYNDIGDARIEFWYAQGEV